MCPRDRPGPNGGRRDAAGRDGHAYGQRRPLDPSKKISLWSVYGGSCVGSGRPVASRPRLVTLQKIVEGLAGFGPEAVSLHVEFLDAIQAKGAEVIAQLAPG